MMETVGLFMLVKNEVKFARQWLAQVLPFVDEVSVFDGNSTDGTQDIISDMERNDTNGGKINLYLNRDPADLREDYTKTFHECLRSLSTDWAFFLHPDMEIENPEAITAFVSGPSAGKICASATMRSFAGEPGGELLEILGGRIDRWKLFYRLKNPDLGAHYHGAYGDRDEDVYFRAITGNEHTHMGPFFHLYPYEIPDMGLRVRHYSDVRTYARRLGRMRACLVNQDLTPEQAEARALIHPRVTLKDAGEFRFIHAEPAAYLTAGEAVHAS